MVERLGHLRRLAQMEFWTYWPMRETDKKDLIPSHIDVLPHLKKAIADARVFEIVEAIREGIGVFRTVFGVKFIEGRLAWEFYFYDCARRERDVSISRVLAANRPFAACDALINESLPYLMFSLDLGEELASGARKLDVVHMHVGNPGSAVSSGIAHAVRAEGTRLENFYFFFDARSQRDEVADKIRSSAYFDATRLPIDAVLVPELRECRTICVANKQTHDCVYFSGVDVDQLLYFLRWLDYPAPIVEFVTAERGRLDHLLYDVGFDYRMEEGALVVLKSGYYGVF